MISVSFPSIFFMRLSIVSCLTFLAVISRAAAEDVGQFRNDWTGNSIVVEAIADPKVQGVTCHISRFSRSLIDRLSKGDWFVDPSNSCSCQRFMWRGFGSRHQMSFGGVGARGDRRSARGTPSLKIFDVWRTCWRRLSSTTE